MYFSGRYGDAEHCWVQILLWLWQQMTSSVLCYNSMWKSRAENSQSQELLLLSWSSPVPPCSCTDILPENRIEFVFRLSVEKSTAKFLCGLPTKRIQQKDSLFSYRSFCCMDKCLNTLVPLGKRGNSISLLLPSPAERCSFLRQGLPLA